jgi:pyridoxamine 5'-phosphate oxidase
MEKQQIIDFIKENPLFFLATCEGKQARVRGIRMYRFDERGLIFSTGKNKGMYAQLKENPAVELCFYHENTQVRITGDLHEHDDPDLKKEIVEARPFMKPWIEATGYDIMAIFSLTNITATWWELQNPLARKRFVKLD